MNKAATPQPAPQPGTLDVLPLVLADMQARSDVGLKQYGTRLMADNGRDHLWDAYQEALDLAMYLRAAIAQAEQETQGKPGHTQAQDETRKRIVEKAGRDNEFVTGFDGFVTWWPLGRSGFLNSFSLRVLADELDRRNADWNANIREYMKGEHHG